MSIYRPRRSPYYHFDFEIERYRFSGSTKCRNERDAQAIETARKKEARALVDRLIAEGRGPMTLGAAAKRWWNEHGSTLSDTGLKSTLDRLVEIMRPKTPLHAITDDDVSKLVEERRKDRRRDRTVVDAQGKKTILYRPIAPRTVNRTTDLLRQIMNRARDNWNAVILREPKWKKHRLKEPRRHVRELSRDEEERLDAAEAFDYAELRRFAIVTGLRRRDCLVTWPQVDFELGVIRVMTKGRVPRIVPMTKEIYAMLWRRRGHHPQFVFTYQAQRNVQLPKSKGGTRRVKGQRYPITYYGFGTHKRRTWAKAGVDARIHDLRHTAGSRVTRRRGIKAAQQLLGHTDIAVTARFYANVEVEDLRAAMEAADEAREIGPARAIEKDH